MATSSSAPPNAPDAHEMKTSAIFYQRYLSHPIVVSIGYCICEPASVP
jgi:hypothetical protein